MTPQERELISTFLEQMKQTQAGPKDPEAESLISAAVAGRADASYLLVQRAVGLDYALQAVKADLQAAQVELAQLRAGKSSSFMDQGDSWGRSGKGVTPSGQLSATAGAPAQAAFSPAFSASSLGKPAAAAAPAAAPAGAWGSGMLGTVATTAAGVVAGSFLFQGIQGLMGHHNNPGDSPKAADAGAASVPPPSLPPEHLAAADIEPAQQVAEASFDDGYADSGDGGDSA